MDDLCQICGGSVTEYGRARIRGRYHGVFFRCQKCGFIFVREADWLNEAYAEPINRSDTGYVARNLWCSEKTSSLIAASELDPDATYLDYAAGYGLFVRLMRDRGYDFRWNDPYCTNLFVRGFEVAQPLAFSFEAITAFEVLEHLLDPVVVLEEILAHCSTFIFSTKLVPDPAPALSDWWYYGLEHGQHVAFYTKASLEQLAARWGYQLFTDGADFHVLSRRKIEWDTPLPASPPWWKFWTRHKALESPPRNPLTESDHVMIVRRELNKMRLGTNNQDRENSF